MFSKLLHQQHRHTFIIYRNTTRLHKSGRFCLLSSSASCINFNFFLDEISEAENNNLLSFAGISRFRVRNEFSPNQLQFTRLLVIICVYSKLLSFVSSLLLATHDDDDLIKMFGFSLKVLVEFNSIRTRNKTRH